MEVKSVTHLIHRFLRQSVLFRDYAESAKDLVSPLELRHTFFQKSVGCVQLLYTLLELYLRIKCSGALFFRFSEGINHVDSKSPLYHCDGKSSHAPSEVEDTKY